MHSTPTSPQGAGITVLARTTTVARLSIGAGALFAVLLGSLHVLEPEYDPTWRFVSEYALGDFGWIMTLAFALLAASIASVAVVCASHAKGIVAYLGILILVVAAVGLMIAAIYPTDPLTAAAGTATLSGKLHVIGASLDYTPLGALLISFALSRKPAWKPVRITLFVTATVTICATIAFIAALPPDYVFGPGIYAGLIGRLLLLSYLGWIFTVCRHAIRLNNIGAEKEVQATRLSKSIT